MVRCVPCGGADSVCTRLGCRLDWDTSPGKESESSPSKLGDVRDSELKGVPSLKSGESGALFGGEELVFVRAIIVRATAGKIGSYSDASKL